jgi:hemerythrin
MGIIEWDDSLYSLGLAPIDKQHKQLVDLINALDTVKKKSDDQFVARVFNTLIEYTEMHFKFEEHLLEKIGYGDLKAHKKQHQAFINKVNAAKGNYELSRNSEKVLDEILDFLKEWLLKHILKEDRAYADYLFN